jgi:hypothetical protein
MAAHLIQWALVVLGAVYFVTDSAIFSPFRIALARGSWFRAGLFYCAACFGFWAGVVLCPLWPLPVEPLRFLVRQAGIDWEIPLHWLVSGTASMTLGAIWKVAVPNTSFEQEQQSLGLEQHHDAKE